MRFEESGLVASIRVIDVFEVTGHTPWSEQNLKLRQPIRCNGFKAPSSMLHILISKKSNTQQCGDQNVFLHSY